MAKGNSEIELKLLISKEDLAKLLAADFMVQAIREGSKKQRHLVSCYYDTADMALKAQGVVYRVRDKGDGSFEATVKSTRKSSHGLSERLELNLPLTSDEAVLTGFKALGLEYELTELAPAGVQKLFTVDVQRTTYILEYLDAVVELAIDKGCVTTGAKEAPIDEIELELMEGSVESLLALQQKIAALVKITPEEISKYARGLALLGMKR